jgi:molybdate-binding protein/DNA-binding transcriptional regulator YhcF (GntR family)
MNISFRSDEALYLQIADHFRRQVALGRLHPGERLPSIRELARKLGLDPGTVARAYRELEKQEIISSRRGGGSFISTSASEKYLTEQQQKRLGELLEKAVLEALGLGFTTEDIEVAFTMRLAEWRARRIQSALKKEPTIPRQSNGIYFFGSHDIAIELLASHLSIVYPDTRLFPSFVGSLAGILALEQGEADIAGAHLLDNESGEFNIPFIKRLMPNETVTLMNLMQRVQGLILAARNPKHITGIKDLTRTDITFVNRQKGSGTRMWLDSQLLSLGIASNNIRGYEREEKTHVAVSNIIAQGEADVGLGAQSAASIAGLDFIPLFKESYDLITLQANFEQPRIQRVKEVISSKSFQQMLNSMPGYDLSQTGNIVTVKPNKN